MNPLIEPGIRRQDCGQITDNAAALVLAGAEVAAAHARRLGLTLAQLPRIAGWGHRNASLRLKDKLERSVDSDLVFPHVRQTIQEAFARADLADVSQIDGIETHDCFTTTEYMAIDHFGLTQPRQSRQAVEDGRIELGGTCPINPSGGLIGGGDPVGATGTRMLLDAAQQVTRRAGEYQAEGARRFATLNIGGSCATVCSFVVEAATHWVDRNVQ